METYTNQQKGSTIFNTAWSIARNASKVYGDKPSTFLGESLRITHSRINNKTGQDVLLFNLNLREPKSVLGKFRGAVLNLKRNTFTIAETGFQKAEYLFDKRIVQLESELEEFKQYSKVRSKINSELNSLKSLKSLEKTILISKEDYNWLADLFYNGMFSKKFLRGKEREFRLSKYTNISGVIEYRLSKLR